MTKHTPQLSAEKQMHFHTTKGRHRWASASNEKLIGSMLDAMGDNEFYAASYSSKDQPHVEGLFMTLAEGLRAKEEDILKAQNAGETITPHEIARKKCTDCCHQPIAECIKDFPRC